MSTVTGYRPLTEKDKAAMNELKALEATIVDKLESMKTKDSINQRSLALGITNIQTGFMWAVRSIARPNGE